MSNRIYNCRGFSLLEVLIAVAIMSVIALMLYSSLYIAVKAKKSSLEAITPYDNVGAAFEYIRKDLSCTLSPGGTLAGDFVGTDQTGSDTEDYDILSMFTTSARTSDEQSGSNVIKVEYLLEQEDVTEDNGEVTDITDDEEDPVVLKRNTTTNLLATITAEASTEVVARDIIGINLRYYDGADWLDVWDSSQNDDSLPQAVEVSLTVSGDVLPDETEPENVTYTKIFILDCYKPQEQTGQSGTDEDKG